MVVVEDEMNADDMMNLAGLFAFAVALVAEAVPDKMRYEARVGIARRLVAGSLFGEERGCQFGEA